MSKVKLFLRRIKNKMFFWRTEVFEDSFALSDLQTVSKMTNILWPEENSIKEYLRRRKCYKDKKFILKRRVGGESQVKTKC